MENIFKADFGNFGLVFYGDNAGDYRKQLFMRRCKVRQYTNCIDNSARFSVYSIYCRGAWRIFVRSIIGRG
jgi:hypothetical protein